MLKLKDLSFPISYVQIFQEIGCLHGVDTTHFLLSELGITTEQLNNHNSTIHGIQFHSLLSLLNKFLQQDKRHQKTLIDVFPPTVHGQIALAAITAATVRQALDVGVRFAHQVMPAFEIRYRILDAQCQITFIRLTDFGDCNDLMTEMIVCALHSFLRMFGHKPLEIHITLKHNKLTLTELPILYQNLSIDMGSTENRICFPSNVLDHPIVTRNEATYQAIANTLETQENNLSKKESMANQVKRVILAALKHQTTLSANEVAQQLRITPRTLNRRLAGEATNVRRLYNECRCQVAQDLLTHSNMSVGRIGTQLGFSDEANFSRFFKQQTGIQPTIFRARKR